VAYFDENFQTAEARRVAQEGKLAQHYRMVGTPIRIDTNRPLGGLAGLEGKIEVMPDDNEAPASP
jgi:hypothetical protein